MKNATREALSCLVVGGVSGWYSVAMAVLLLSETKFTIFPESARVQTLGKEDSPILRTMPSQIGGSA